jgi:hypothetical protein
MHNPSLAIVAVVVLIVATWFIFRRKSEPDDAPAVAAGTLADREPADLIREAEDLVFGVWSDKKQLARQSALWNAQGEISLAVFTEPASPDRMLADLRSRAERFPSRRAFYFFEAGATAPDGGKLDVIVIESGDVARNYYTRRMYRATHPPELIDDDVKKLDESPWAGLLR